MYKIAVASTDGKVVNAHFGKASQFVVVEVTEVGYRNPELRLNNPSCSNLNEPKGTFQETLEIIKDCRYVIVSQIGQPMVNRLLEYGIKAYVIRDFVDDAIKAVIEMES